MAEPVYKNYDYLLCTKPHGTLRKIHHPSCFTDEEAEVWKHQSNLPTLTHSQGGLGAAAKILLGRLHCPQSARDAVLAPPAIPASREAAGGAHIGDLDRVPSS